MCEVRTNRAADANPAGNQEDPALVAAIASKVLKHKETARKLIEVLGDGTLTPEKEAKAAEILSQHDALVDEIVLADELKKLAEKLGISEKAARAAYFMTYADETNKLVDLYEPGVAYRGTLMVVRTYEEGDGPHVDAEFFDFQPDSPRGPGCRVYLTSDAGDAAFAVLRKAAPNGVLLDVEITFGDYRGGEDDTWTRRIVGFQVIGETALTEKEVSVIRRREVTIGGDEKLAKLESALPTIDMSTIDSGKVYGGRVERTDLYEDGVILLVRIESVDGVSTDGECTIVLGDPEDGNTTTRKLLAEYLPHPEIEVTFCDGFVEGKVRRVARLAFVV